MHSLLKGSYFKPIAAKRVYTENQFNESSLRGMQVSDFEIAPEWQEKALTLTARRDSP